MYPCSYTDIYQRQNFQRGLPASATSYVRSAAALKARAARRCHAVTPNCFAKATGVSRRRPAGAQAHTVLHRAIKAQWLRLSKATKTSARGGAGTVGMGLSCTASPRRLAQPPGLGLREAESVVCLQTAARTHARTHQERTCYSKGIYRNTSSATKPAQTSL